MVEVRVAQDSEGDETVEVRIVPGRDDEDHDEAMEDMSNRI